MSDSGTDRPLFRFQHEEGFICEAFDVEGDKLQIRVRAPHLGDGKTERFKLLDLHDGDIEEARAILNAANELVDEIKALNLPRKPLEVILSAETMEQMETDPEVAKAMKEVLAQLHQAAQGLNEGKYASFEEAQKAVGLKGHRVDPDEVPQQVLDQMSDEIKRRVKPN